jgi:AraC-like DNA-binding protein
VVDLTTPAERLEQDQQITEARGAAEAALSRLLDVLATSDAMLGAAAATDIIGQVEEMRSRLGRARAELMRRALRDGWGVSQLADHLGISRSRVDQIVNDR